MSIWQRLEDMPVVKEIINKAEKEIEMITGSNVLLRIAAIELPEDQTKNILRDTVVHYFKIPWEEINAPGFRGDARVVSARHCYMYLLHSMCGFSKTQIAKECGRDHSTISIAIKKVEGFYKVGDPLVYDIENVKKLLPVKPLQNEKI